MATPEEMEAAMVANLKEKTGKTLPQWLKVTKGFKLEKQGQILKQLKSEFGLTHGFANLIAYRTLNPVSADPSGGDLIATQYAGKKEGLLPIYQALTKAIKAFGKDVEIAPKKAYVSLRRNKQFALIQPSTATRVDVGINLKGEKPTERLEASGSFNGMVSHRVRVTSVKEVNAQLKGWLKKAYQSA